ncbi:ABC transporter ATP-binding protein [bacterium]|nr:ABC transporter ATP-binding protein [bacterium]
MSKPVIYIENLVRQYGRTDAVNGLNLQVQAGRCYGFFGRNGAGKTTTIKCMLDLLKPTSGKVRIFGLDPAVHEVPVKSKLCYVPDQIGFYNWMSIQDYFEYLAAFREDWNQKLQSDLVDQFELDPGQKVNHLSRGQKMQVALIGALCPEPELLILDEPTSGLDPLIRREFIRTVIGAYQDGDPENRTVFISTHLITEFEGLIDEFTIIEQGKELLTLPTEQAQSEFKRLRCRFPEPPPRCFKHPSVLEYQQDGRQVEIILRGETTPARQWAESLSPESLTIDSLSLEDILLATVKNHRQSHVESHS